MSNYTFHKYRQELESDLTLVDLQKFAERFLTLHRRQMQKKDALVEFIVPDLLQAEGLPDRIRNATFDRETAIRRSDVDFLALGHPFVDGMLSFCGTPDLGGTTAVRSIRSKEHQGRAGLLFLFVVRRRFARGDSDECLFEFRPVFVGDDLQIDPALCELAVTSPSATESPPHSTDDSSVDVTSCFEIAQEHVLTSAELFDWSEDVEFLGISRTQFV